MLTVILFHLFSLFPHVRVFKFLTNSPILKDFEVTYRNPNSKVRQKIKLRKTETQ